MGSPVKTGVLTRQMDHLEERREDSGRGSEDRGIILTQPLYMLHQILPLQRHYKVPTQMSRKKNLDFSLIAIYCAICKILINCQKQANNRSFDSMNMHWFQHVQLKKLHRLHNLRKSHLVILVFQNSLFSIKATAIFLDEVIRLFG